MGYVVFEDLKSKEYITTPDDLPVKIHKDSCRYYVNRYTGATTVRWYGPFKALDEAEACARKIGKRWRQARCCL